MTRHTFAISSLKPFYWEIRAVLNLLETICQLRTNKIFLFQICKYWRDVLGIAKYKDFLIGKLSQEDLTSDNQSKKQTKHKTNEPNPKNSPVGGSNDYRDQFNYVFISGINDVDIVDLDLNTDPK